MSNDGSQPERIDTKSSGNGQYIESVSWQGVRIADKFLDFTEFSLTRKQNKPFWFDMVNKMDGTLIK